MLHCTLLLYFDRYILLGQLFTTGMLTHTHILMLTLGSRKFILSVHHFLLATYAIGLSESYPVEILCLKHNLYVCKVMYKIFLSSRKFQVIHGSQSHSLFLSPKMSVDTLCNCRASCHNSHSILTKFGHNVRKLVRLSMYTHHCTKCNGLGGGWFFNPISTFSTNYCLALGWS